VGTTDPRPDPALISAFHKARLTPGTGEVNLPLTSLLGTHVSGGACIWVLGDVDALQASGLRPVGPHVDGAALSSDAEHIITPSIEGPKLAIRNAMHDAGATPDAVGAWDLHATGTPGDVSELKLIREFVGTQTAISARKGVLGHGMANAGGWELTALALGLMEHRVPTSGIEASAIHPVLRTGYGSALVSEARGLEGRFGVKVMLGIGGITACVVLSAP
jgi:3-oxoacyl-(acyl-carrier-protein) synthase